jgi:hypothetical protein
MAVEIEKFRKTYTGLVKAMKECTFAVGDNSRKRIEVAAGQCGSGENFLLEAANHAVSDGVTQTDLGAMMKHPKVKEAITNLNTATNFLAKRIEEHQAFFGTCLEVKSGLEKLSADMAKDLKSRSDKSESKKDIQELKETVDKDVKTVQSAYEKVMGVHPSYQAQVDDLAKIIKEKLSAPIKNIQYSVDKLERHKFLNAKILNHNRGKVVTLFKVLKQHCDEVTAKAESDLPAARAAMTKAGTTYEELVVLVGEYRTVFAKSEKDIKGNEAEESIIKIRDIMYRAQEAAEKLYQTTMGFLQNKAAN